MVSSELPSAILRDGGDSRGINDKNGRQVAIVMTAVTVLGAHSASLCAHIHVHGTKADVLQCGPRIWGSSRGVVLAITKSPKQTPKCRDLRTRAVCNRRERPATNAH